MSQIQHSNTRCIKPKICSASTPLLRTESSMVDFATNPAARAAFFAKTASKVQYMQRPVHQIQRPPALFGHFKKTAFLVGTATHGPCSGRLIAREMSIDPGRVPGFVRSFEGIGIIKRERGLITIDDSFPAFSEIVVLLHALSGQRVIVIPEVDSKTSNPKKIAKLFGTTGRSKALIALLALGEANLDAIAYVSGVSRATVRHAVSHFVRQGVLTASRSTQTLHVQFDQAWPYSEPLRNLLRRILPLFPRISKSALVYRRFLDERQRLTEPDQVAIYLGNKLPFGTERQAQALLALTRRRTLTTATLAATICSTHSTARSLAASLEQYELVVTVVNGKGPTAKRWIALNDAHPLTPALRKYAKTLHESQETLPSPLPPKSFVAARRVRNRTLPGHPLRAAVLLQTFRDGEVDVATLAHKLGQREHVPLRRWAEDLQAAGLIDYGPSRGRMTLRAMPTAPLQDFVAAIDRFVGSR